MVEFTVRLGYAIFTIATLSFLGLRHPAAGAGLGRSGLRAVRAHQRRLLVAGAVPGARDRQPRDRSEPDGRRNHPGVRARMSMSTATVTAPALEFRDLEVAYRVRGVWRPVLRGVSFSIGQGESYGLVGRVRLREVDRRVLGPAVPAAQRAGDERLDPCRRRGPAGHGRGRGAPPSHEQDRDGLSESRPAR